MQSVFEQIKDRLAITDVLSSYLTLIPAGSSFKAKCPFHQERSASFSISPERGLYHCFGCGAKGDIFTFVEQFEGVDRKGALRILAARAGVQLTGSVVPRESADPLYELLDMATTRYEQRLADSPDARAYLHTRGLTDETIKAFRIGYVPDVWRFIAGDEVDPKKLALLERVGLIKQTPKAPSSNREGESTRGGYYDRFRRRVMFPLMDASGRVVGFSGRVFPEEKGGTAQSPKYLNSPETELFQKSRILFGFDKAKQAIRQHAFAILVEGQMDCVLSHQAGFRNTVATSGTAVSEQATVDPTAQLVVLSRLTLHVFLAFDGDSAGQKALRHAALVALSLGMNPKVVPLPEGLDPAEYIHTYGGDAWKTLLKESKHFIAHQLSTINRSLMSPHVLVQQLRSVVFPYVVRVASPLERESYVELIAKELSFSPDTVIRELALYEQAQPMRMQEQEAPSSTQSASAVSLTERFCGLVARYPSERATRETQMLASLTFGSHTNTKAMDSSYDEPRLLALAEQEYGALTTDERDAVIHELAHTLRQQFFDEVRVKLSRELAIAESASDEHHAEELLKELHTLATLRHQDT